MTAEPRLYTYETHLMAAGDGTKCSMLMERLCLMHISWTFIPLSLLFAVSFFCEFYLFIFALFCPRVHSVPCWVYGPIMESTHFHARICRKTVECKQTWWGVFIREFRMSKAETLPLAKMARSERFH